MSISRILGGPAALLPLALAVHGEFDVDLVRCDADGNRLEAPRRVLTGARNLITDTGMNRLGTNTIWDFSAYLNVGTGNTTPANSNTALVASVAVVSGASPDWAWDTTTPKVAVFTRVFTFGTGAAAGVLAELGLSQTNGGTLNTRALFVDGGGSPATITVLSDEQLIVTYRLVFTASETDSTLVTTQKGTEYTLTLRPSRLSSVLGSSSSGRLSAIDGISGSGTLYAFNAGATIGAVTGGPSGTQQSISSVAQSHGAYTSGDHYRDDTINLTLGQGNISTVTAWETRSGIPFCVQIGISPAVTKTSDDSMSFTIRTAWARG